MPLSKARNRARMQQFRLHNRKLETSVQPKTVIIDGREYVIPELDADGNVIPQE